MHCRFWVPFLATGLHGLYARGIKAWFSIKLTWLSSRITVSLKCKDIFSPNPIRKSSTNKVAVGEPCVIPTSAASYLSLSTSPQSAFIHSVLTQIKFNKTQDMNMFILHTTLFVSAIIWLIHYTINWWGGKMNLNIFLIISHFST